MAAGNFELLPDSGQPTNRFRFRHLHNICTTNPCLHGFMFISIIILDIAEITNDALLYRDISLMEAGLVYGPLDSTLVAIWLITFSGAMLAMAFEMLNITRDLFCGKPWADLDLDSALVVWLGEIPTTATNIVISLCRAEPVSYFQLIKSLIVIASVILRSIVPLMRSYLRVKYEKRVENPFRNSVYQSVTATGLCLAFCGAVSVFIFTHILAIGEQRLELRLPQDIWTGNSTYEKYFTNVGIYFHHRNLRVSTNDEIWLKLADIEEVYEISSLNVKVTYTVSEHVTQRLVINSYNTTNERYRECYRLVQHQDYTSSYQVENCTADFITQDMNPEKIMFKFVFLQPQLHLVLGDIAFNAKYIREFSCFNVSVNDTQLYQIATGDALHLLGKMMYMKQETRVYMTQRLVPSAISSKQHANKFLYEAENVMASAEEIWRSGIYGCDCTGRLAPRTDKNLEVRC